MKKLITLAMLLFASTLVPASDLDKTSFNLVKINKSDFNLSEKSSPVPATPKVEPRKVEPPATPKVEPRKVEPPKNDGTGPKIEPRPMPRGKVEEVTPDPVYKDGSGNIRRRADDGGPDWYWSPTNGGFWWRSGAGSAGSTPKQPFPPPGI